MHNAKPNVLYGQTISLCEKCLLPIEAKIIFKDSSVFFLKTCPEHGQQETLVSTDIEYFKLAREEKSFSYKRPFAFNKIYTSDCSQDCGICDQHEQHTCMAIVELLDECNMRCPTCIASSHPGAGNVRSYFELNEMLDTVVRMEGSPDIVMLSGGEPTVHPNIIEVIELAKSKPIKHIMLISNGVRIAQEINFVQRLAEMKGGLEVYLQFDSLDNDVLLNIRGEALSDIRIQSIENLEKAGIPMTLVCVVKKQINDHEMNAVIEFALQYKYIRGVTFQPCKITGRNDAFDKENNYITLSEVRSKILEASQYFSSNDIIPHPCNPENIAIGYLRRQENTVHAVTQDLIGITSNFPFQDDLRSMMFFLPTLDTPEYNYDNLFRVSIVSFLDKFNFCMSSVKKSCIHFVTTKQELIPIDTYYLWYAH